MKATPATTALHRLAKLAGVQTSYEDVFGAAHYASDTAVAAILTAMHFDVSTEERAAQSLADHLRATLARGLEPVAVFAANVPIQIAIFVRRDRPRSTIRWTLVAEDGTSRSGVADLSSDASGERTAYATNEEYERQSLALDVALEEGYYDLRVADGERQLHSRLIVAPASCYLPPAMERHGLWGLAAHVYALRSKRTTIAGDFTDLATLCEIVRAAGGSAVAVNPLHLLPRGGSSPYGPSSRTFVNWAYLDVTALPGHEPARGDDLRDSDENDLVDYERLYRDRAAIARAAFERFRSSPAPDRERAFAQYRSEGGDDLRLAAIFESLAERFRAYAGVDDWRTWPSEYRDPHAPAVEAYAREAQEDVAFYSFLQWQCDVQLAGVARACDGMPVGLYRDLAVGTQIGGVDAWLEQRALLHEASVGAPPDLFNRSGQNWGVAPFDPLALRAAGYEPFAKLLRANARHAGALRIDHVMALLRLWWVPAGFAASDGAYVAYPLDELIAVLALESRRAKCLIVGEDLGTVPPGFRERMEAARIFSYRVLQFEHDGIDFAPPSAYPAYALAATGTHDLPTMAGFWDGTDLELRARLAGTGAADAAASLDARVERDRMRLALRRAFASADVSVDDDREIGLAANVFLAKTPSLLLMLALEDVLGETAQLNLPATTDEYPNWRHRSALSLDDLASDEGFVAVTRALRERSASLSNDG